jgi:aspartyl-tRNA(Asn)/glutamyl-tRNA(Gln) amidotransferase subunit B
MSRLLPIIGLEIHLRLKTQSKMFCRCPNVDDTAAPNTAICPVCTGQPGALPAVNQEAVRLGVRAGLALGCAIPDQSHFDRKNYFYPDLPKGYQISQYDFPISERGAVSIDVPGGKAPRDTVRIGITRAHLEEDAAKNIHDAKSSATLVDFNRAGVPLLEIVTEPDFRSPQEAKIFLQELQAMMRTIGVSNADMEKGYMRCDANVSLLEVDGENHPLKAGYNPKIECKNLNSFKAVERAIAFEIERQTALYAKGETPVGATRGWDENTGETFEQRLKETNADYRYFPEPDLPPLVLTKIREEEKTHIPELPAAKRERLSAEYGFSADDARVLVSGEGWAEYAEDVMGELGAWLEAADLSNEKSGGEMMAMRKKKLAKLAGGWLTSKLAGILAEKNLTIADLKITAEDFAEFLKLVDEGAINSMNAQKLLTMMVETGTDPSHLMEEHNLGQSNDPKLIIETVARLIEQNPDQVKQVKEGKLGVLKWFVGGVMKATEGKANPAQAEEEVKKQLGV